MITLESVGEVAVGGAIGAPLRYLTDRYVQSRHAQPFPWGTFAVNAAGSLVLGLVAGLVSRHDAPAWVLVFVGTGVCGALTTFSTFSVENVRLVEEGRMLLAVSYATTSLVVGFGLCGLGWWLA